MYSFVFWLRVLARNSGCVVVRWCEVVRVFYLPDVDCFEPGYSVLTTLSETMVDAFERKSSNIVKELTQRRGLLL